MSANELRHAAKTLRERAESATMGPWVHNPINGIHTPIGNCVATSARHVEDARRADAAYIATMHPEVGLAVSRWLDSVARVDLGRGQQETHESCDNDCDVVRALAVARLINGGQA